MEEPVDFERSPEDACCSSDGRIFSKGFPVKLLYFSPNVSVHTRTEPALGPHLPWVTPFTGPRAFIITFRNGIHNSI